MVYMANLYVKLVDWANSMAGDHIQKPYKEDIPWISITFYQSQTSKGIGSPM